MTSITTLQARCEKLFLMHEIGLITTFEAFTGFIDIILRAPDDDSSLQLCAGLPLWFSDALNHHLREMAKNNYYARTFGIGDTRTSEEVHQDALRQQKILMRLAPKILAVNSGAPPTP